MENPPTDMEVLLARIFKTRKNTSKGTTGICHEKKGTDETP